MKNREFLLPTSHTVVLCVVISHTVSCVPSWFLAHCRVMSCRMGAMPGPWGVTCVMCRPRLEHFPRETSEADPGDPDLSHSFSLRLTCSQTSPSTPSSQAEDPIPGQAQLQASLLINDCWLAPEAHSLCPVEIKAGPNNLLNEMSD